MTATCGVVKLAGVVLFVLVAMIRYRQSKTLF